MEATLGLVPARDRQNVITALVIYAGLVFGLSKSAVALAFGRALPMLGYELPTRAFGGYTTVLFVVMLVAMLFVFRRVAAGGNPAGRALFSHWLLQGALLLAAVGAIAAAVETVFLGAVVPAMKPYFEPQVRGTVGVAVTAAVYGIAVWIAYRWAKGRVDAR
jgi:hypothetical protein